MLSITDEQWKWAKGMAAALIEADVGAGYVPSEEEPNRKAKQQAMKEIVRRIRLMRNRHGGRHA